ncbi:MAG: 4-hydroxythreonine-4-phosphate dehydrogenase PdxA [Deltaproteobacteria bacterium]|nr:4-hydroxythreonine-4-phosphate dehydrogenase PdxA [Deltaproteobacteria bacterium]
MGDPAGIGPEIIVKALADGAAGGVCRPVVLGDPDVMEETAQWLQRKIKLRIVSDPSDVRAEKGEIDILPLSRLGRGAVRPGEPEVAGGSAMVSYIVRAVEMIQSGKLDAMVTCPISKALMQEAGHIYEGHTQLIAHLTRTRDYVMMLAGPKLRVTLVTIHCALKDVPGTLTGEMVHTTIRITAESLIRDFDLQEPRLAVAALNPHAGESGIFGSEEANIIEPAVRRAREAGFHVEGPLPADTLFHKAVSGGFDAVVAMYHDQGLIPLKLLHFSDAVNVTLGLPIVRTSVDHGTAYDIAGKGQADPASLMAAIRTACDMVENRWKRNSLK